MIGVFDSGLGGLSVWREMARLMPNEQLIYLADQAHVPYGSRELLDVRRLTVQAVEWLLGRGCDPVVLACNTASAAALNHLRRIHPERHFVGMEPAVKPAALQTRTGAIGVLATQATFQGDLFAGVVARYAGHVRVVEQACPGWVELVEAGCVPANPDLTPAERADSLDRVARCVNPLLDAGADTLVLGCTHFPLIEPFIVETVAAWQRERGLARPVSIIDPSPAVARQAQRVHDMMPGTTGAGGMKPGVHEFWTTGDAGRCQSIMRMMLPEQQPLEVRYIPDFA